MNEKHGLQELHACDAIYNEHGKPDYNYITDDEFRALFDELEFQGQLVVQFISCASVGIIEDIAGPNRLAWGTGDPDKLEMHWWQIDSYPWYALAGYTGAEFDYIDLDMNPDANSDGKISLEEAYYWAVAANEATDPTVKAYGGGPVDIHMVDGDVEETFL